MTVHMFRVFIGRGSMSLTDLETRINDWVESNPEWTEDLVDHTLTERNTEIDGTGATYYGVDVRFTQDETKSNLIQKLTDKLKDKVDWYRVGYHACEHDQESASPCSWDDKAEWTAKDVVIVSGVPDFDLA